MRKCLLVITFVLAACFAANAESVPATVAARKAAAFLHLKSDSQLKLIKSPHETFYLFGVNDGGFVIVSADNRVQPILGYSLSSSIDVDNLPSNFAAWLAGCDKQIRAAMEDDDLPVHFGWLEQGMDKSGVDGYDSIVGPLLTTTWAQEPQYNDMCPLYGGSRTLTGCIATAMAQVMKYWNWPDTGVGQHSYSTANYGVLSADFGATAYDWTNMPTALTSSSSAAQVNAVATLMYHCGVAVEMKYGINASGISSNIAFNNGLNHPCPENALRTYFKYSAALTGVRRSDFTSEDWASLIKNEIDHRRPVLYAGIGLTIGHEFVCDGYDTNGYFHFNWGWNGLADGYFTFSSLNPAGNDFSNTQSAIIGIEPDTLYGSSTACTVTVVSADTSKGSVSGGGTYNYRDTVILNAIPANGYRFLKWSNGISANPYPVLAHDISLTAYFANALAEDGDILSYTGTDVSERGVYTLNSHDRIGMKLSASVLAGHKYLSAVYLYHYDGDFVVYVHHGGDEAPGPVVYTQPYTIPENAGMGWHLVRFENPVPIDTNENLWITVRIVGEGLPYMGARNLGIPDGNWISTDDGASWQHLNQIPNSSQWADTTICWYLRCVTSQDSIVDDVLSPTAFLIVPEQCNVGDTVIAEILHSSTSTVEWIFHDADFAISDGDTAFLVWDNAGMHSVEARVEGPGGSSIVGDSILVLDCNTPISSFPYIINYGDDDEVLRACWQLIFYGESHGYYNVVSDYFAVFILNKSDDRYISPLFDLSGDREMMLEINYISSASCLVTVEVSQGGVDSSDFTTVYTLPATSTPTVTPPIDLSQYYQGNPVRVAIRMRKNDDSEDPRFEMLGLRIWDNLDIDDVEGTTLAVYPNPARRSVTVTLPETHGTLTLFDATGRQLMQCRTTSTETTVDVHTLPQGVYMLQYTSPRGTATSRLVVQ